MNNNQLRSMIRNVIKETLTENEQYDQSKLATDPSDIAIIARTRAFYSYKYLVDDTQREEVIGKVQPRIEKLSPNTPEEQWEMFINTVKYHNSAEAKAELERAEQAYRNNPAVLFRSEFEYAQDYYKG